LLSVAQEILCLVVQCNFAVKPMPIFMTTATTVAGLTSLMFGGGPLFKGLATVFAVGLIVGSTITLFVLPALMALFVENFRFNLIGSGD
jgi:Cu/Ag efflux pump CusA